MYNGHCSCVSFNHSPLNHSWLKAVRKSTNRAAAAEFFDKLCPIWSTTDTNRTAMLWPGRKPVCSDGKTPYSFTHRRKWIIKHFSNTFEKHGKSDIGLVSAIATIFVLALGRRIIRAICQWGGVHWVAVKWFMQDRIIDKWFWESSLIILFDIPSNPEEFLFF